MKALWTLLTLHIDNFGFISYDMRQLSIILARTLFLGDKKIILDVKDKTLVCKCEIYKLTLQTT